MADRPRGSTGAGGAAGCARYDAGHRDAAHPACLESTTGQPTARGGAPADPAGRRPGQRDAQPTPELAALTGPAGRAAAGRPARRSGLPLDAWLLAAIMQRRAPRRAAPAPEGATATPAWAPAVVAEPPPAVLRLPADAIGDDGVIALGNGGAAAVLVAATTVNVGLRTGAEQAALVGSYGRWLNSLTGPVHVVVSAQRVDLTSHALRVAETAQSLPHPALADAALDYS